jgi:hypothetical protein
VRRGASLGARDRAARTSGQADESALETAYRERNKHDRKDADVVLEHSNVVAQRDRLQQQRSMVRSSLPAIGTAPLVAIAMKAGYP